MPIKALIAYANRKTRVIHSATRNDACRAREIKLDNVVRFFDVNEVTQAKRDGYRDCKKCMKARPE